MFFSRYVLPISLLIGPALSAQVDYARAEQMLTSNLDRYVFGTEVAPHWMSDSTRFWYRVNTPRGGEYYLVDPMKTTRRPLFDNTRLAAAISAATDSAIEPGKLSFTNIKFEGAGDQTITFTIGKRQLRCDLAAYRCTSGPIPEDKSATTVRSPDGKWEAFGSKYNLFLRPVAGGDSIQLTTDGVFRFEYGFHADAGAMSHTPTPTVKWSPDSRYLITIQPDYRNVKLLMLYSSTSIRPTYKVIPYAMPGDSIIPQTRVHVIDIATRARTVVRGADGRDQSFNSHVVLGAKWSARSDRFYLSNATRDTRITTVYEVDPRTAVARPLVADSTGPARFGWELLKNGDIIMSSWRDNWLNMYLHDSSGKLKHQITRGRFSIRDVLHIDEK